MLKNDDDILMQMQLQVFSFFLPKLLKYFDSVKSDEKSQSQLGIRTAWRCHRRVWPSAAPFTWIVALISHLFFF